MEYFTQIRCYQAFAGKGVTGITDPYINPSNPELTIDTSNMTPMEAVQEILLHLEEQGYLQ